MLCAIYCRLSKEDDFRLQDPLQTASCGTLESESIQNQKSMLVKYAVEHDWEIYGIYCDEDFSGADATRPDFCRMLKDAEAGRFQMILCKSQSRFTRDMELVEKYIHGKFLLWGIRFIAVADHVDTAVRGSKKARQINGLINEWYLEDLSENIRMVFDFKRRQGQYIGGIPLYGYRKSPYNKNKLIVDVLTAPVVRQIFEWYLEGNGTRQIAGLLNQYGIDSPAVYKQKLGLGGCQNSQSQWSKTAVSRILHNEMYTGVMVQGRKRRVSYKSKTTVDVPEDQWCRVPGTHEAVVAPETFQKVQELMRPRTKSDGKGEIHVLSGLVRCADCGSAMTRTSNGRKGEKQVNYLRCGQSLFGGDRARCTRHSVRLDALTALIRDKLIEFIAEFYEAGDPERFRDCGGKDDETLHLKKKLRAAEEQTEKWKAALQTLYLDRVSGAIDEEQFFTMNQNFLAEEARVRQEKTLLNQQLEEAKAEEEKRESPAVQVQKLLELDPVPRELLVLCIERIEVGERDPDTGQQSVHIVWKF